MGWRDVFMLSWLEIDSGRIRSNIAAFRELVPSDTRVMVVVKANAYGHGLEAVAPVASERADWLGVNHLDEARAARLAGVRKPIAVLGHTSPKDAGILVRHGFRQIIYRLDLAQALSAAAVRAGKIARIHLKIETGTQRQGVALKELPRFLEKLSELPGLVIEGAFTHFANIEDTLDPSFARVQLERFSKALTVFRCRNISPPMIHAAASAGAVLYPDAAFNMIRVGIGAYGVWPSRETQIAVRERGSRMELLPALSWKTRIVQTKVVDKGEGIGYGLTYRARQRMKIGIIPVGYYEGFDRKLSNCGRALVGGQSAPVVGRVMMNMTLLDITTCGAGVDDEVVLLGRQLESEIRVEELAQLIGSIPYEVLSRINPLLPRKSVFSKL